MGFEIALIRPDGESLYVEDLWDDHKYVGNIEFVRMAEADAEWKKYVTIFDDDTCFRPRDIAALREKVKSDPPAGCDANIPIWLDLLSTIERDPTLYLTLL